MNFDNIIFSSSEVEELELRRESIWVGYGPNHGGQHVSKDDLKVILDRTILSAGIGPRFQNHGNNVLIFGDESYRQDFLRKCGFPWEWIFNNLLPEGIPSEEKLAEIIPFPNRKETDETNEPQKAAL